MPPSVAGLGPASAGASAGAVRAGAAGAAQAVGVPVGAARVGAALVGAAGFGAAESGTVAAWAAAGCAALGAAGIGAAAVWAVADCAAVGGMPDCAVVATAGTVLRSRRPSVKKLARASLVFMFRSLSAACMSHVHDFALPVHLLGSTARGAGRSLGIACCGGCCCGGCCAAAADWSGTFFALAATQVMQRRSLLAHLSHSFWVNSSFGRSAWQSP
mmetsp:Transcript_72223/g.197766  ORF Transcript_72223/g.197766 Transcript_72223/m.197766 type:complete len:216 (-) Transcript_72223:238-885(-)